MAYEKSTAVDLDDLFSKLETFATTHGWTIDRAYNDATIPKQPAYHKNSTWVSFRYDNTSIQAQGISVGIYQALGYTAAQKSGNHPDDSGSGYYTAGAVADSTIDSQRCIYAIGDGPFNYWFFERDDGGTGVYYIHVVVERSQGEYRHFGFGKIDKFGDWGAGASGGEYVYGHRQESAYTTGDSSYGLDGGVTSASTEGFDSAGTLHVEGYVGQEPSKWACVCGSKLSNTANRDRASLQRSIAIGAMRYGPFIRGSGFFTGYPSFTGVVPMTSVHLFMLDFSNITAQKARLLGVQADVRFSSIANFEAGEEVVIGSDTWVFFPITKKGTAGGSGPTADTYYAGAAYRKDVT